MTVYKNRQQAGQKLAEQLSAYAGQDVVVLSLARGGVLVGYEVAQALHKVHDVLLVRKLRIPGHAEFIMGAVAEGGVTVLNPTLAQQLTPNERAAIVAKEQAALAEQGQRLRGPGGLLNCRKKQVILVDDGLVTGVSMQVALQALRTMGPKHIVVAVPVAAAAASQDIKGEDVTLVALQTPEPLLSLADYYDELPQVSDAMIAERLNLYIS